MLYACLISIAYQVIYPFDLSGHACLAEDKLLLW
ncbi:hypothetical protein SAMN05216175_104163 [Neptunomonas qingdaonensis]|uniref:Uncharacterized protein n=1 Tax=Neptunomonas qingdaonensis TaxID=1045558 RepID=A0A1I2Q0D6_9GAMM|nr:hypothetical protein SAMN05216175_104163 [Neptunomonas qingdaonensis]